ncbi:hypothetical protein GA0070624_0636 [Micromonospora rhizosphaerae]|uniref:Uncharacterized protein n=1 Tax=Micromonospora rhizosphaerae TaxID=568872 RepID=A0A1C6RDN7_9ACTN|nr:hypothetical protein [Micromonospora rhizosphaerae]SCL15163.1 hypothetical protein GA0070624_0636 [Micromonospora rhizosphaerae]
MRKTLTLLVSGLIAALLGVLALGGVAAAATTTPEEAAQAAKNAREAAQRAGKQDPYAPQLYGSR